MGIRALRQSLDFFFFWVGGGSVPDPNPWKNHIMLFQDLDQMLLPAKFEICNLKNLEMTETLIRQNTMVNNHFRMERSVVGSYRNNPHQMHNIVTHTARNADFILCV